MKGFTVALLYVLIDTKGLLKDTFLIHSTINAETATTPREALNFVIDACKIQTAGFTLSKQSVLNL